LKFSSGIPFSPPESERGRKAAAYFSLLLVFWSLLIGLAFLEVLFGIDYFSSGFSIYQWAQVAWYFATVLLAVFVAYRVGRVSYLGVALTALIGITGVLSFMTFSSASPGRGLALLGDSWTWLAAPVWESCIALFVVRFLHKARKKPLV